MSQTRFNKQDWVQIGRLYERAKTNALVEEIKKIFPLYRNCDHLWSGGTPQMPEMQCKNCYISLDLEKALQEYTNNLSKPVHASIFDPAFEGEV